MNITNPLMNREESDKYSNLPFMFLSSAFFGGLATYMLAFKNAEPQRDATLTDAYKQIDELAREIRVLKAKIDVDSVMETDEDPIESDLLEQAENNETSVKPSKAQGMVNHLKHTKHQQV